MTPIFEAVDVQSASGLIRVYTQTCTSAPRGTLLCIHGGPGGDHRGNNAIFDQIAEYSGQMGYNMVQFDMYGAGASQGKPSDITLKSQLADYEAALRFTESTMTGHIHVVGESMGATIAALSWNRSIATYILLWPAFDLRDTDLRPYLSSPWIDQAAKKGFIEDVGNVMGYKFLKEIVEQDFSDCYALPASPCMIVHGKGDKAVPFQQSIAALQNAKGECVLFAHPDGDHGLQGEEERAFTHTAIRWWLSRIW